MSPRRSCRMAASPRPRCTNLVWSLSTCLMSSSSSTLSFVSRKSRSTNSTSTKSGVSASQVSFFLVLLTDPSRCSCPSSRLSEPFSATALRTMALPQLISVTSSPSAISAASSACSSSRARQTIGAATAGPRRRSTSSARAFSEASAGRISRTCSPAGQRAAAVTAGCGTSKRSSPAWASRQRRPSTSTRPAAASAFSPPEHPRRRTLASFPPAHPRRYSRPARFPARSRWRPTSCRSLASCRRPASCRSTTSCRRSGGCPGH
mmetsp:Transcript_2377/g.7692  ORF Transcript_2377/g.7692 Transcript_2377/m.7692 type:complete len:263 (+) Transcript_2377:233-1021(+)